jgi:hypothetical protein
MSEPKTFASLGPTLLARKGGAKPAMRPQLAPLTGMAGAQAAQAVAHDPDELEDLGWNDMGQDEDDAYDPIAQEAQVFSLTPAPSNPDAEAQTRQVDAAARAEMAANAVEPTVLRQQRDVVASIGGGLRETKRREPTRLPVDVRRAAFTLRLDAKRHLKLRLASTVKNRSAQQLVTAALDKYLAEIPEIEALAAQVTRD